MKFIIRSILKKETFGVFFLLGDWISVVPFHVWTALLPTSVLSPGTSSLMTPVFGDRVGNFLRKANAVTL